MSAMLLLTLLMNGAPPPPLSVNGSPIHPTCSNSDGTITIYVSGGTPPYSYAWDDGPTTASRTGLAPGFYQLTVTDDVGAIDTYSATLVGGTMNVDGFHTYAGGFPCPGQADGSFAITASALPGVPPYNVQVSVNSIPWTSSGTNVNGDPVYSNVSRDDYVAYTVSDGTGCAGSSYFLVEGASGIPAALSDNTPACGPSGGSILISPDNSDWPLDLEVYDDAMQLAGQSYQSVWPLQLTDLVPGDYTVYQYYTFGMTNFCVPVISYFTIGDLGPDCGTVNGSSWYDVDADCVHDAGEVGVPYSPLLIQPGAQNAITNASGAYHYLLVDGSYTLEQSDPTLVPICPPVQPVPFTVNSDIQVIDLANGSTQPLDLAVYGAQGAAHPGFNYPLWATVRNVSPQVSGPVTATLTFDPALTFVNASPTPAGVVGNTITWNLPAFGSYGEYGLYALLNVPVGTALGTLLISTFDAGNTLTESNTANNAITFNGTVTGSFDPNEKTVRTSTGWSTSQYFIGDDEWMDYTIRFQNTGTDTAFTVVVTDTVSTELDMSTYEQGAASHPFEVAFKPGRVVEWRFDNILLPDSGVDEAGSHGLVSFRIKPVEPVMPGTILSNAADIHFDFNPPVHTNDAVVVAEFSTQVQEHVKVDMLVFPNPAGGLISIFCTSRKVPVRLEVLEVDGRCSLVLGASSSQGTYDIGSLRTGVHVLKATFTDGSQAHHVFVKQ